MPKLYVATNQPTGAITGTLRDLLATAALRRGAADMLQDLTDRVRDGRIKDWQIHNILPSLQMIAHVLKPLKD